MRIRALLSALLLICAPVPPRAAAAPAVAVIRTPGGGLQPQAVVDHAGALHLIYFQGDPAAGDLFYVRRAPGDTGFSEPLRVNSGPASAIAVGSIRGAQIAVGRNGRVHVAWNGSQKAEPKAPGGAIPMLYSRLNDQGTAFEPQRNLIQLAAGLDGGGSIAADRAGNVYVTWHAPQPGAQGEIHRRVWVARSGDDGRTFDRETPAWDEPTGACGCCGMRAFAAPDGTLYILYRAATHGVDRDMFLLTSSDAGRTFHGRLVQPWKLNACPMTSASIVARAGGVLLAWETDRQVWFAPYDAGAGRLGAAVPAPGAGSRKHPVLAVDGRGEILLAWAEGTGFRKGGTLEWQIFDTSGHPVGAGGNAPDFPASSLPAAVTGPEGGFLLIY
jgi:hypothetical protein